MAPRDYYPKGTIALANAGAGTNSSHFFIFYNDSSTLGPAYSIAGRVTKGLEIVETLAKGGAVDSTGADVADGKPKTPIVIQTLLVGPPPAPPTPTSSGTGSPTPAAPANPTSSTTPTSSSRPEQKSHRQRALTEVIPPGRGSTMSSVRDRQRAAARARLEREMAVRAEAARRKRLLQARIGAGVAGALVLAAVVWIIAAVSSGGEEPTQVAAGTTTCEWRPVSPEKAAAPGDQGRRHPAHHGAQHRLPDHDDQHQPRRRQGRNGSLEDTVHRGELHPPGSAEVLRQHVVLPARAHDLRTAVRGREQHRSGPRTSTPTRTFPTRSSGPRYRDGEVANANGGPNTNGSQFFFIFGVIDNTEDAPLGPQYSVLGRVVEGLDIIKRVAAGGFTPGARPGEGKPKLEFKVTTVTVSERTPDPTPSPAGPTPTAAPAGSAPPSAAPPTASPTP